jgi:hypothetical protein
MANLIVQDGAENIVELEATGDGSAGSPLLPYKFVKNLGALLGTLAHAQPLAAARTQVAAALQFFNGASLDMAPGDITNGLDVDVTRLPTAAQGALDSMVAALGSILTALTGATPYVLSIAAANTTPNAFPDRTVKVPVHIHLSKGSAPVTIDDGVAGGAGALTLEWDDVNGHHQPFAVFYVSNLNQLRYTFSSAAGGNSLSLSSGY